MSRISRCHRLHYRIIPVIVITVTKVLIDTLSVADKEKDIGLIIDKDLTFSDHMNEKINEANRIIGLIRRSFTYLTEDIFLQLYKALVRPHLEYANCIWFPYKKKDITLIENVQRRATKLIPSLKNLSYEDRLRRLKLPSLAYRRTRDDMIETYKMLSGDYDPDVNNLLIPVSDTTTRDITRRYSSKELLRPSRRTSSVSE